MTAIAIRTLQGELQTMPFEAKQRHYDQLTKVITLAEACRRWQKTRPAISYAIDVGNIAAYQCGRIWLVSVDSLRERWGEPPNRA